MAWSGIIEAGTGKILSGPLTPEEEGIIYADIDLNYAATRYFLRDPTGHGRSTQFQVYFDVRDLKPLIINKNSDSREDDASKIFQNLYHQNDFYET